MINNNRIEVVDALRGFAVMGIILLHSIEHFNFYNFPDPATLPAWLNTINGAVWTSLFFLFSGKAYSIFAILFGFTFHLQFSRQLKKGKDFGPRFLWRLLLLAGFGLINGAFFPGEILLMYALIGIVFYFTRHLSNKTVFLIAVILLLQPIELYHFFRSLVSPDFEFSVAGSWPLWGKLAEAQGGSSFIDLVISNTLYGHKAGLVWSWENGRITQTAGLFLLGVLLGRKEWFVNLKEKIRLWKNVLIAGTLGFIMLWIISANLLPENNEVVSNSLGKALNMWNNFAFTSFLVAGFILLFCRTRFYFILEKLMSYGKMSLTNYVTQSIVGGFIYYGYGLGLSQHSPHLTSFLIGIGLFILQISFCTWWLKKHNKGPLEHLWHKLTWIRS